MRITVVLCRQRPRDLYRLLYKQRRTLKPYDGRIPKELIDKNIPVYDGYKFSKATDPVDFSVGIIRWHPGEAKSGSGNCNQSGHYRRDCPQGAPIRRGDTSVGGAQCSASENSPRVPWGMKYIKPCLINGKEKVNGLMDTGCSSVLIRADAVNRLGLKTIPDPIPIYGTGDISNPSTIALGRVILSSLQVDEGYAENVEAMVVANDAIPEDLFVGRTFLDLPHFALVRINDTFFVGPTDSVMKKIHTARRVGITVAENVELMPGTAAFVEARTNPNAAVVVRETERDFFYHSDDAGRLRIPFRNTSSQVRVFRPGDRLGSGGLLTEEDLELAKLPKCSSSVGPVDNSVVAFNNSVGCQRRILPHELNIDPSLPPDQQTALVELINEYSDVFSFSLKELGCTHLMEADIELEPGKLPPRAKPYRLAPPDRDFMEQQVQQWRETGIVTDTQSPYASPAFVVTRKVPGKTQKKRVVVDVRRLNAIAVDLHWPIPNIEDELMDISDAGCFAQLDFMQGFMQIPLARKARRYAAFITPESSGEFTRMPFGYKNGPAIFNHLMSLVLGPMRRKKTCFYFFDDVLVKGRDANDLLQILREVFTRLRSARLTLNPEKCRFGFSEVTFMGVLIKDGKVSPTEDKLKAIAEFPAPTSATQVRQFLGLCCFFRRFIPGFATVVAPLTPVTSTKSGFAWGSPQNAAFEEMKSLMRQPPVLTLFNSKAPIEVHTDASSVGLAGMLLQPDAEGRLHLVRCVSRKCNPAEKSYHSSRLELLAIMFALDKLRSFLIGRNFKLVTDCQALLSINTRTTRNPQMARWLTLIQDFQFTVEHRAGERMKHVDALSRNPVGDAEVAAERLYCGATEEPDSEINAELEQMMAEEESQPCQTLQPSISADDEIRAVQREDPRIRQKMEILEKPSEERTRQEKELVESFELYENCLYKRFPTVSLLVIPDSQRKATVIRAHDLQGHFGVDRTCEIIKRKFWFPRLKRYVKDHIARCIACLSHKRNSGRQPGLLRDIPIPRRPFDWVHLDHVGPYPTTFSKRTHILVIVDRLTKFSYLEPVRSTSSEETARSFEKFTDDWGVPAHVTTDRGTAFTGKPFKTFLEKRGIIHHLTCPRRAQGNGQVERVNGILTPLLAKLLHNKKFGNWDAHVKKIQLLLNTSVNVATGETPIRLLCGFDPEPTDRFLSTLEHPTAQQQRDPNQLRHDAIQRIKKSFEEAKKHYDRRHRAGEKLGPGDIVWFTAAPRQADGTSRKLDATYRGPMVVTRALDGDTYAILSVDEKSNYAGTAHISQLRLFGKASEEAADESPSEPIVDRIVIDSSDFRLDNTLEGPSESLTNAEIIADEPVAADERRQNTDSEQETRATTVRRNVGSRIPRSTPPQTQAMRRSTRTRRPREIFDPSL